VMTSWFYWSESEGGRESAYPLRSIELPPREDD
jgi:hypothetical protein